jgi:hypothetical protein
MNERQLLMRYDATYIVLSIKINNTLKLEALVVDTLPGLESSLLTTSAGSQATVCACHHFLSIYFAYGIREVDDFSIVDAQQRMAKSFRKNAARPLFSGIAVNFLGYFNLTKY